MIDLETKEKVFFSVLIVKENGIVHKFRITAIPEIDSFTAFSRHYITNDFDKYYEISNNSKHLTKKQFNTILDVIMKNEDLLLVSDKVNNVDAQVQESYQYFYFACDEFEKEIKGYNIFDEDDTSCDRKGMDNFEVYTVSDVVGQIIGYLQGWSIWTTYPYLIQDDLNNQFACFEISAKINNKKEIIYSLFENVKNSTYFFANREFDGYCLEEKWITPVSKDCYDSICNIINKNKSLLKSYVEFYEQRVEEPYQKVKFKCDSFEKCIKGFGIYFPNMNIKGSKDMKIVNSIINDIFKCISNFLKLDDDLNFGIEIQKN